jgi:peptidoglycan/LPS O-acetylase OafA/YrhL
VEEKIYFKNLDTLRFIAFFLVFWQHAFQIPISEITSNNTFQVIIYSLTNTGGIGVHIFFVISGFLITFLMLCEKNIHGSINIKYFYIRRILRIWPLYYIVVLLGIFVLPNLFHGFKFHGDILKNLIFLNNFDMDNPFLSVGITWSIAIEEQFYIFWPIIFLLCKSKKMLLFVSSFILIFSFVFIIQNPVISYFHTFGNLMYLMIGCVGAILYMYHKQKISKYLTVKSKFFYFILIVALFFIVASKFYKPISYISLIGLPIIYLFIVLTLVNFNSNKKQSLFSKLGKYTYGMYIYHPIILIFFKIIFDLLHLNYIHKGFVDFLLFLFSLIITIVFSILSYEYFEKYILQFKNKFSFIKTRI